MNMRESPHQTAVGSMQADLARSTPGVCVVWRSRPFTDPQGTRGVVWPGETFDPLPNDPWPFTRAVRASTWKKGLVLCMHAELYHFHGILYSSVYFLYISEL